LSRQHDRPTDQARQGLQGQRREASQIELLPRRISSDTGEEVEEAKASTEGAVNLSIERLREVLSYSPESGLFFWKIATNNSIKVGQIAGCACCDGYMFIRIDSKRYMSHRLAWFYMTGNWPKYQIDHIDCDKANNRISNLREATNAQNQRNRGRRRDNSSGYKGVSWNSARRKWQSRIKLNGRYKSLGYYDSPDAAWIAYCESANRLHGEFARTA